MAFKLAISSDVEFPVHIKVRDGARMVDHRFHIIGKRLSAEEARQVLDGEGSFAGLTIVDFLNENIIGWRDQKLVQDADTGRPVEFGSEAFAALLSVAGAGGVIHLNYLQALAASDGSEGRRKN